MAKQNNAVAHINSAPSIPVAGEGNLDGFTKMTTDVDLFYSPSGPKGEPVAFQGIVLEKRERKVDDAGLVKAYFIVQATAPFFVKDMQKNFRLAEVGEHVWVDERASYARIHEMLPRLTPQGTYVCEVLYRPTAKVPLKGGKTMWKGDLLCKVLAPHQHTHGALGALAAPTSAARLPEHMDGIEE